MCRARFNRSVVVRDRSLLDELRQQTQPVYVCSFGSCNEAFGTRSEYESHYHRCDTSAGKWRRSPTTFLPAASTRMCVENAT